MVKGKVEMKQGESSNPNVRQNISNAHNEGKILDADRQGPLHPLQSLSDMMEPSDFGSANKTQSAESIDAPEPLQSNYSENLIDDAVSALPSAIGNTSGRRRSGWQLLVMGLSALLLFSLLLYGGIALASPGTIRNTFLGSLVGSGLPASTVTIAPKSVLLSNTYVITSTFGTPDPSRRQIEARQLAFTTQPQAKTVPATGKVTTQGTHATGTISFYNSSTSDFYVAANDTFTDAQGIVIATDSLLRIPAGNPNLGTYGHATASAHAVNVGVSGNLPAGDIANMQCCGDPAVGVTSTGAFSGGQDPQNFTAVQQSDVDNAANPLKPALLQSALTTLNGLKHTGEQYVSNPSCKTQVMSNPGVGSKATSVTVSITATCSAETYDQASADTIAANLLKAEADKDTGGGYALSGTITTSNASSTVDSTGNVTLLVKTSGTWMHQFDSALKTSLAKLIAGKSKKDATNILLQQPGIDKVDINGDILPTDYTQISIVVPLLGPETPTVGTDSPTPTVSNATPTDVPPSGTTTPIGGS